MSNLLKYSAAFVVDGNACVVLKMQDNKKKDSNHTMQLATNLFLNNLP